MYEIFEQLLLKHKVTPYQVYKATGIAQSTFSDWKKNRGTLRADKLQKIASYFNVSMEYMMGTEEKKEEDVDSINNVKVALFGGDSEVTDEMWDEVKEFAKWVKAKNDNDKSV